MSEGPRDHAPGTDSCQVLHTGYHVSGRLHVRMDDGTEEEFGPGDAYVIYRRRLFRGASGSQSESSLESGYNTFGR